MASSENETYPQRLEGIRDVAVIGAGISGVATAAHLLRHGLRVTAFERSAVAGGVWHYDARAPADPPYPSESPPTAAGEDDDQGADEQDEEPGGSNTATPRSGRGEAAALAHAPPGPCYAGLRNNVPTSLMRSTLLAWPADTPEFVSHVYFERYVQELARTTGAHERTRYNTRVESVAKKPPSPADGGVPRWTVKTRTLVSGPEGRSRHGRGDGVFPRFVSQTQHFDAVVVASGHYHEPRGRLPSSLSSPSSPSLHLSTSR